MAEEASDGQERTEDPTDERRQEFRDRGEVVHSRELTSLAVLVAVISFISFSAYEGFTILKKILIAAFLASKDLQITPNSIASFFKQMWFNTLYIIIPICLCAALTGIFMTFAQTKLNLSFKRLSFDLNKLNPFSGIKRLVSLQAIIELLKSLGKMLAVGIVAFLILYSERTKIPALLNLNVLDSSLYFAGMTKILIWSVAALLLIIAGGDYLYNFVTLENRMKMTKQEIKEDYKKREVDPMVRNRLRRMQRELSNRKTIQATQNATVLITNPTHYAVAIHYELGMRAPKLVAKGIDFIALRMREVANEFDIPLVENKPLARTLYKTVDVGEDIPESLYQALSEIIRYVFKIKGIKIPKSNRSQ